MTDDEATAAVHEVLVAVAPELDPDDIDDHALLRDDLDLDSMDFLNVIIGVHERTGVQVPERDYELITDVAALVAYLQRAAS
jgi:acyl carrier protein